jgi:hypothetical protein
MQFGTAFEHVRCVQCAQEIREQPVRRDDRWYHALCYDTGLTRLQHGRRWAQHGIEQALGSTMTTYAERRTGL